jgi:hypothetical protein
MSGAHGIIGNYRKGGGMMKTKPYSIDELITAIYEDNYSHIEFIENMNGGDCDCNIHNTMNLIQEYM